MYMITIISLVDVSSGLKVTFSSDLFEIKVGLLLTLKSSDVRSGSLPPTGPLHCLLCFIRLFWNHTLTCRSVRSNAPAISIRRGRHKYLLKWNSFSSSNNWLLVYAVRNLLDAEFSVRCDSPPWVSSNK